MTAGNDHSIRKALLEAKEAGYFSDEELEPVLQSQGDPDELVALTIQLARDADAHGIDFAYLRNIQQKLERNTDVNTEGALLGAFRGSLDFVIATLLIGEGNNDKAGAFLQEPSCLEFIHRCYGVPRDHLEGVQPLKGGDTSLLLTCGKNDIQVLKLLQLKYLDLSALAEPFATYRDRFGDATSSPRVLDCGRGWILMERIEGKTLREYIDEDLRMRSLNLSDLGEFLSSLLSILADLDRRSLSHCDLSPDNIVLSNKLSAVHLINFGENSLLRNNVGESTRVLQAQVYASPDFPESTPSTGDPVNTPHVVDLDIYAVGVIILEWFAGERLSLETIQRHLDAVWRELPDLAMIIDDCLTQSGAYRALEYKPSPGTDPGKSAHHVRGPHSFGVFDSLGVRLQTAITAAQERERRPVYRELMSSQVFSGNYVLDAIWQMTGAQERNARDPVWTEHSRKLEAWKKLCVFAFSICVAVVPVMIVLEGLDTWKVIGLVREFFTIEPFTITESIPGRLVCFSFTIVAAMYYVSIFQSIDIYDGADEEKGNRATFRAARFWMRFNSFCFALPILWAEVVDPLAWPYCAALGLFFVGMNNYWVKRAAIAARESLDRSFRVYMPAKGEPPMGIFTRWDKLVFSYAAGLVGIGVFLLYYRGAEGAGLYQVELAFAVLVVVINYVKMQRENCLEQAPDVRRMLLQIFLSHKRLADRKLGELWELNNRLRALSEWLESANAYMKVDSIAIVAQSGLEVLAKSSSNMPDWEKRLGKMGINLVWCQDENHAEKMVKSKRDSTTIICRFG